MGCNISYISRYRSSVLLKDTRKELSAVVSHLLINPVQIFKHIFCVVHLLFWFSCISPVFLVTKAYLLLWVVSQLTYSEAQLLLIIRISLPKTYVTAFTE